MSWIFKTEPTECSIDDIAAAGANGVIWEGVRNYQARNFLRDQVKQGDMILIHHSSCQQIGIAGLAKVASPPFADPSQFEQSSPYYDPKATADKWPWFAVNVTFEQRFARIISMNELRQHAALAELLLLRKGNRLSIMPIKNAELELVLFLNNTYSGTI